MFTPEDIQSRLRNAERQRIAAEEQSILHRGTAAERRALLKLRLLPLPDDVEAVAVPAVAILDLPQEHRPTTVVDSRGRHRPAPLDPLEQLADRYGGNDSDEGDDDALHTVNFAAFIEVLCPNGTPLLERLPLPVSTSRTGSRQQSRLSRVGDASSPASLRSSRESSGTSLLSRESTSQPLQTQAGGPVAYVNVPISLIEDSAGTTEDAATPSQVFISVGAESLPLPRGSRLRHSRVPSPSSHRSRSSLNSADLPSSASVSSRSTPHRSGPHAFTFLTENSTCDLGGRVLLTDRLIVSQTTTVLPTMLEAYRQYCVATTLPSQPPSRQLSSQSQREQNYTDLGFLRAPKQSTQEMVDVRVTPQSQLAPRQRGIVLRLNNTTEEVLNCVELARQCARPSFRYIDPVQMYGTSTYSSRAVGKLR